MPEEDFIAKHAPAGDRATAEAFREIYREVVEDLVGSIRVHISGWEWDIRQCLLGEAAIKGIHYAREFTRSIDGHMLSVRQIKARGDFEEAIRAALPKNSRER